MNQTISFKKKLMVTTIASMAGFSGLSVAQNNESGVVEEVLVRGIKGSLERSIDVKRNSSQLVEAITADDIGKMPDQNVAESLQRLPGIQIDRNNGEGTKVRIRGLDQNITLLNGGTFISGMEYFQLGEAKQEFDSSLEGIPSELLGGVEVYKTPKASVVEGGLGGVINLKTRDAFDLREPLVAANIKADYGLDAEDAQPSGFLVLGNNWDDKFAAILSLSASKKTVHSDSIQSFSRENTAVRCTEGGTFDAETMMCSAGQSYFAPGMFYVTDSEAERERIGASLNLQWNITDAMQVGLDWFHSELDVKNRQYSVKHPMNTDGAAGIDESQPYVIDGSNPIGIVKSATFNVPGAETNSAGEVSEGTADNFALRLKHDNGGKLRFSGDVAYAESELEQRAGYSDTRFSPYAMTTWTGESDNGWSHSNVNVGTGTASRSFNFDSGSRPSFAFANPAWLSDPSFLTYKSHWALGADIEQESFAVRGDVEYDIEVGHLKKITFGFRYAEDEADFRELRYLSDFSKTEGAMTPNRYDENGNLIAASTFDPSVNPGAGGAGIQEAVYHDLCGNGGIVAGRECDIDGDGLDDNQPFGPWGYFMDAAIGLKAFELTTSDGTNMAEALYGPDIRTGDQDAPHDTATNNHFNRWGGSPGVIPWETYLMNPDRAIALNNFFPSGGYQSNVMMEDANKIAADVEGWIDAITPNTPGQWFQVPLESWNVKETTTAFYGEADFEGDNVPYTLNIGVRVVQTEVEVSSAETTPESSLWSIATDSWNSQGVLLNDNVFTVKTKEYWDVLPSLNFVLDTTDETKLRFSASRVIARPDLQTLGKGFAKNFTREDDPDFGTYFRFTGGSSGNPGLDPYRATQADVAYEWYFDDLGLVSAGAFVKAVDSFLAGETRLEFGVDTGPNGGSLGSVSRTVNGSGGSVKGLEFTAQKAFENGFGATFNYTFSDSTADVSSTTHGNLGLPGISEHAFNLIGFYENDSISARIAYTWRDEYLSPFRSTYGVIGLENGASEFFDDYGQWDANITYDLNENFSFTAEAINITGEEQTSYLGYAGQTMTYTSQEPRVVLGVNYRM